VKKSIKNSKKKILLLIGNVLGMSVLKFLKRIKYLEIQTYTSDKSLIKSKNIKYVKTKKTFIKILKRECVYDFLIIVYWPWMVPKNLFEKFRNSINFHPAFLPYGRGWYPHVHAIIKKIKWGVTLHKIFPGMDNGDIWCQKEIKLSKFAKSTDLYSKAKLEILKLFKKNFKKILNGKIIAKKQKGKVLKFHKTDLLKYDKLFLNKKYKLIDLIRINNARTFKDKTFNFFIDNSDKYEFKITVKKLSNI
tara:strand:- start:1639 stop:2382 length:744 start_codon:yes stop_codon:yes gene_type:complete